MLTVHHIMPVVMPPGGKRISILKRQPRTNEAVEMILKICAACSFMVDDACQHLDCKLCPGKQKRKGGLLAMIQHPNSRCPDGRWKI